MNKSFAALRFSYGRNFTKTLYEAVPKAFFDSFPRDPIGHQKACTVAGLTMILIKLNLS